MTRRAMILVLAGLVVVGALTAGTVYAGAAPTGPLAQLIEGAKKEGTVSVKLTDQLSAKSIARLEKEIKEKFGVDLKIKFTPTGSMSKDMAAAIMEYKMGVPSTYELLFTSPQQITEGLKAGIWLMTDWKPLLSEGTNPNLVPELPELRGSITTVTTHFGLMYNPEKVKAGEVPKKLLDLANPKWQRKVGLANSPSSWVRWSLVLGREKLVSDLRAIMKNGAIQGRQDDLYNRYLIGETPLITITSSNLKAAQDKGMPAAFQCLDFADLFGAGLAVLKGAPHPNAARLVAVYLASPQGARFTYEEAGPGNLYYPGNIESDIRLMNQKQGIREVFAFQNKELLALTGTKEDDALQKEIQLLLQTGGER